MSKSGPPYPDYQRACGWTEASDLYPTHPRLTDVQTCDAIIIGAGYTGIGIARQLTTLLPDSDIRVLEAETVGAGSPGRNSGFVLEHAFTATNPEAAGMLYRQYTPLSKKCGRPATRAPTHQNLKFLKALPLTGA